MRYVVAIGLYFLALAHRGLAEDFNTDDTMNLCVAYLKPLSTVLKGAILFWTGYIRPLGALFYLLVYSYAGYWSRPFRLACFVLLLLNLWLAWRLFNKLSDSREFAPLALLVVCFQAGMSDIYMSTGTAYDILCQTFFLLALTSENLAVIALCAVAAVDAKEVGVAIPAVLLAHDLIFRREKIRWPAIAITGLVSAVFMWSRLFQRNELTDNDAYQVTLTLHQYLLTTTSYINQLVFRGQLSDAAALAVLLLPLLAAALLRSRLMLFGWLYYVLALAPMSFSRPRFGYALYVPYTGVAILLAGLMLKTGSRKAMAAFAALIVAFQIYQSNVGMDYHPGGEEPIREVAEGVSSKYPSLPKGSSLLLVNDPFGNDRWGPFMVLTLKYRDRNLKVERAAWDAATGPFRFPPEKYDHIILFANSASWELKPGVDDGGPASFVTMSSADASRSIVRDIGGIGKGEQMRWANQDPVLTFRVPRQPAKFLMNLEAPDVILRETGPLKVQCWIGDHAVPGLTIAKPGPLRFEATLPQGLRTGEMAPVRLHVENPFVAKGDGARLSFLVRSAGFVTVE